MEYNIIYTRIIINVIIIIIIIFIVILFYVLSPLLVFEYEFECFYCLQTVDGNDYNTFKHTFILLTSMIIFVTV